MAIGTTRSEEIEMKSLNVFAAVLLFVSLAVCGTLLTYTPPKSKHVTDSSGVQVPINAEAPAVKGHPQTAVVVTQCDQLVVAYLTLPSGELVRFDKETGVPWETVLEMAYSATRSERVEVECTGAGVEGYESHTPDVNI
jgi:hypothetical protein